MKTKIIIVSLILSCTMVLAQKDYTRLWEEVTKLEEQSLPQSALKEVDVIYKKALAENNGPELIKALIHQLKYTTAIDMDMFPDKLMEIEKYALSVKDPVEQSVLYSVVASLYYEYYNQYSYMINQRTALSTYIPEDMQEWSGNIFIKKIRDCVLLSIKQKDILQETSVLEYKEVINEGESSRTLRPTMYDFLMNRAIEILGSLNTNWSVLSSYPQSPLDNEDYFLSDEAFVNVKIESAKDECDLTPVILQLYQELLAFRINQPQIYYMPVHPDAKGAVPPRSEPGMAKLMVDLRRLEFVYNSFKDKEKGDSLYLKALESLRAANEGQDYSVEIISKEVSYYIGKSYSKYITTGTNRYGEPIMENDNSFLAKAYQLCIQGINEYGSYERIDILKSRLYNITSPTLSVNTDASVYPGENFKLNIKHRNVNSIRVDIYKIEDPLSYTTAWNRKGLYKEKGSLKESHTFDLKNEYPYLTADTSFYIKAKDLGCYEYVVSIGDEGRDIDPANSQFSVSRLASSSRHIDGNWEFLVVDMKTGAPLEGAKVELYKGYGDNIKGVGSAITNKNGLAEFASEEKDINFYSLSYKEDAGLPFSSMPWVPRYNNEKKSANIIKLFTDRSIYRPGQTVFVKGIASIDTGNEIILDTNNTFTLVFKDANSKQIATKEFVSNEYGSFSGEFTIPHGLLNGMFTIESKRSNNRCSFRVEEYKRPTFDINFKPIEKTYNFGDKVSLLGEVRAFSGINLQEKEVQYRITKQPCGLYRIVNYNHQVDEGKVLTDDKGHFEIVFTPEKTKYELERKDVYYTYHIEVIVTDSNGETQSANTSFNIGDKSMELSSMRLLTPLTIEEFRDLVVEAKNLQNVRVKAKGNYEVYLLDVEPQLSESIYHFEATEKKKVYSSSFVANEKLNLGKLKLPSGRYRFVASSKDDFGRDVEYKQDFTIYSLKDKKTPVPVYEWVLTPKTKVAVGEKAEIIYGTAAKDVYVLYELFSEDKRVSLERFVVSNENKKIEIPYLESYGENLTAIFTFVKDKKMFEKRVFIEKKKENKALSLKMETFRDKLLPGQKEEWKLSVKDASGKPVIAEVLVGMYDASLDKISSHSWTFNPITAAYSYYLRSSRGEEFGTTNSNVYNIGYTEFNIPDFQYDSFNWFGFSMFDNMLRSYNKRSYEVGSVEGVADGVDIADLQDHVVVLKELALEETETIAFIPPELAVTDIEESAEPVQVRQNFNETAFFYPQLKTNEDGETIISFTVPESNTTWKFMGLAHTKDLKYGQIMKEAISQKKLMVTPNVPRFMRQGDKMTISANISNLSDESLAGEVELTFFDPANDKVTITASKNRQSFTVDAGKTVAVTWSFDVPSGLDMTALKIVAQTPLYSDGEQHLVPVLPNRMMVTESLPLNVKGGETKTFSLDKLVNNSSSSLENYRLTLEFAGSPVWYAIQALPAMQTPKSENVISWFGAYYANTLAVAIANSTPKIKQIIDVWTKQGGTAETLLSNLEKNEELKAVLLEETPWVMEAKDESEQKQRLALLFDINRNTNLNKTAMDKIASLQQTDGGWSWFKGMRSSASITQYLLYGLANLSSLASVELNSSISGMQSRALYFIDSEFKRYFNDYKKNNSKWKEAKNISTYELEYLYVRGMYGDYPLDSTEEAISFYTSIIEKNWAKDADIYKRSLMAVVLKRAGKTKAAQAIIKSLREHSTTKSDLGMYWARNNTNSFIFQSATACHTFVMEAFNELGASAKEMDNMKLWLLKQKQTQEWESTPATVNAVNILVKTGGNWLDSEGVAKINLGNKKSFDTSKSEAGTAYIKELIEAGDITPDMGKVKVSKDDEGPAWGAIYWQYFEDMDKITSSKTGLNVEKAYYVEKTTNAGKTLVSIDSNNKFNVGDKVIVRLTVRNDRDMEYVMLKDMRAACFEPAEQLSGYRWAQAVGYYQTTKDASTNFYFDALPKGTYVFEYPVYITSSGRYSAGITTIQCMYAPEFVSHTGGASVVVE